MSVISQIPQLDDRQAAAIAAEHWGLEAEVNPLPGERDLNFALAASDGRRMVLKVANAAEHREQLEAQNEAMLHLQKSFQLCPRPLPSNDGTLIVSVAGPDGQTYSVRLLSFIPGRVMGDLGPLPAPLLEHLGTVAGGLSRGLADFDHPAAHRPFSWDLATADQVLNDALPHFAGDPLAPALQRCAGIFAAQVAPHLGALRRSVIHNDGNDHNLLVHTDADPRRHLTRITGLIDFGDMVHSITVAEIAVVLAYALLHNRDALHTMQALLRPYHEVFPLTETEMGLVFPLALVRLALSACHAQRQQAARPDDPYLSISQEAVRRTLPRLLEIHPRLAVAALRRACGLAPIAHGPALEEWLPTQGPCRVLDLAPGEGPAPVLDLGIASTLVSGNPEENTEDQLSARIWQLMDSAHSPISFGQYNEPRLIYTSPLFAAADGRPGENRTIHLGVDLFAAAGTGVVAPLEGQVHLCGYNAAALDYGGLVILRHESESGPPFFSLYGHLDPSSFAALSEGDTVFAGQRFAALGGPECNGGWPPHLHFQLILDLLDTGLDFPGVCSPRQRPLWCAFSPDPNLLLQRPELTQPDAGDELEATLTARRHRLGANLSLAYSSPLKIQRGFMQYLFDHHGRRFLDAYNNVPHLGHCHPAVVEAAARQMAILNTNTRYLHDHINRFAEALAATMPDPLEVCFFLNSASEANELALRLARTATGRRHAIVLDAAYHGHTNALIDLSPYKHAGPGGSGAPDWVHVAPLPDTYRGPYRAQDPEAVARYLADLQTVIDAMVDGEQPPCAFLAESYPSVGGQIILPDGYLRQAYEAVRAAGGLCIADEVQTGYGRIGTSFYAFEAQGAVPDIVVLGKPIGNGHPLAAVVTTREIANAFANGMEFFSTFGGNTVSCAVGLEVLERTLQEGLQAHALEVGRELLGRLTELKSRHQLIGDVRGSGLFIGVELVTSRDTREPASAHAAFVADRLCEEGILIGTDGPHHNVLKIRPPMPFDHEDAARLVETLGAVLAELPTSAH